MSDLRKLASQALEYLAAWSVGESPDASAVNDLITELDAALAQPEQEPVGWFEAPHGAFRANPAYKLGFPSELLTWNIPLYIDPPQRKPLTVADIKGILEFGLQTWKLSESTVEFARAIEAAHGIGGEHE